MISPNTPPGTHIVCIDDNLNGYSRGFYTKYNSHLYLQKDKVYTVGFIIPNDDSMNGYSVMVNEVSERPGDGPDLGYDIARFSYPVLPKSLTKLLVSKENRVKEDA